MDYFLIFNNFVDWININLYFALLLFFLFILLYSLFSIPGLLLFIVFSGYAFGVVLGYIVCVLAFTIGCFSFFLLSKSLLKNFFKKYLIKYSNKIDNFIKDSSLEYLIIFRMIPGPPLLLQNFILSLLNISNYKFIISTFVGISPLFIFSVILGNKINDLVGLNNITVSNIFTFDFLIIIIVVIILIFLRIVFKKK